MISSPMAACRPCEKLFAPPMARLVMLSLNGFTLDLLSAFLMTYIVVAYAAAASSCSFA